MDNIQNQDASHPVAPMIQSTNGIPPTPQVATATSNDTRTLVTVLLLIFMYPIGLLVMWFWTKWKWWVKILVSLPVLLILLFFLSIFGLLALNPSGQLMKSKCTTQCANTVDKNQCVEQCMQQETIKAREEKKNIEK